MSFARWASPLMHKTTQIAVGERAPHHTATAQIIIAIHSRRESGIRRTRAAQPRLRTRQKSLEDRHLVESPIARVLREPEGLHRWSRQQPGSRNRCDRSFDAWDQVRSRQGISCRSPELVWAGGEGHWRWPASSKARKHPTNRGPDVLRFGAAIDARSHADPHEQVGGGRAGRVTTLQTHPPRPGRPASLSSRQGTRAERATAAGGGFGWCTRATWVSTRATWVEHPPTLVSTPRPGARRVGTHLQQPADLPSAPARLTPAVARTCK